MTNKPAYMRKIIIGSSLLFSILLAVPQAHAQESVERNHCTTTGRNAGKLSTCPKA